MAVVDPATEELYMPSRWVKRVRSEEVCTLHVQVTSELSRKSRNMPQARLGVSTGPDSSDVVDIFNEAGISSSIVVYVSGGYWLDLSGDISAYTVQPLVAHGHTVVVVHYDRAPTQTFTQIMQQVNRSIEWIVEYAQRTKKKIWLSGHSAGSHLCAMALSSKWFESLPKPVQQSVSGIIHLSGIFDLVPILSTSVNTVLKLTNEDAELFSPISKENLKRICKLELKHEFVLGEHDSPAFHTQAEQYRLKLEENGCKVGFKVLKGLDHFSLVEDLAEEDSESTQHFFTLLNK